MIQDIVLVQWLPPSSWLAGAPIVGQMVQGSNAADFLTSIPWFAWVAMVAIVSGTVSGYTAQVHRHRERMEMIRQGMNPDAPGGKPAPAKDF